MTTDTIVIHDDELYREPVERVDAICEKWWTDLRGGRPEDVLPRTTVWNVAGQSFVVLRDTGLVVVHYAPGPAEDAMTVMFTRIPVGTRERFAGADVVVSWPAKLASFAFNLERDDVDPWYIAPKLHIDVSEAVPFAEFLTTLAACPVAFVYAGSLDAMPG